MYLKGLFSNFKFHLLKSLHILVFNQLISIHSACLMQPETNKVHWSTQSVSSREQNALHVHVEYN